MCISSAIAEDRPQQCPRADHKHEKVLPTMTTLGAPLVGALLKYALKLLFGHPSPLRRPVLGAAAETKTHDDDRGSKARR
jgi:hypothetical protein